MSVDVTNAGERDADEVVQLYIHQRYGIGLAPGPRAQGLRAGHARGRRVAARCVHARARTELRYWNAATRDWVIDATDFDVWVGGDSTAELSTTFRQNAAVRQ